MKQEFQLPAVTFCSVIARRQQLSTSSGSSGLVRVPEESQRRSSLRVNLRLRLYGRLEWWRGNSCPSYTGTEGSLAKALPKQPITRRLGTLGFTPFIAYDWPIGLGQPSPYCRTPGDGRMRAASLGSMYLTYPPLDHRLMTVKVPQKVELSCTCRKHIFFF